MRILAFWVCMGAAIVGATHTLWAVLYILIALMASLYVATIFATLSVERKAKAANVAAIVKRADRQHRQVMRGKPSGVYGEFPPAKLD